MTKMGGLDTCVHGLRADEEQYVLSAQKDTHAKLIVVNKVNGVELEKLIRPFWKKVLRNMGFMSN